MNYSHSVEHHLNISLVMSKDVTCIMRLGVLHLASVIHYYVGSFYLLHPQGFAESLDITHANNMRLKIQGHLVITNQCHSCTK